MTNDIDIDVILKNLDIEKNINNCIDLLELPVEDLTDEFNLVNLTSNVSKIYSTYTILELFKTLNKDQIIELWEKINKEEVK